MKTSDRPVFCRGHETHLLIPLRKDVPLLLRWINDADVSEFLSSRFPFMEKNEEKWIETAADDRLSNQVLIIGTGTCKPIGTIGLHRIDWVARRATLGISIGEKSYWGKKHGTEAMMLLLHYAFDRINLRKIELGVHDFNERAQKCYTRCGFKVEGCKRQHMFRDGAYHDTVMMGILAEEFLPVWKKYSQEQDPA